MAAQPVRCALARDADRPRRYKFYLQIDVRAVNEHSLRIWQVRRRRCVCVCTAAAA
jgi:hypothetical protein